MDLITIELANIERELNQIYTLKKNQRNHKKILLLKQRHQDLIFRMQMVELEETAEENAAENAEEHFFDDDFEGVTMFENMPLIDDEIRLKDTDVEFLTSIAESHERIRRLNKRCKYWTYLI